MVQLGYTIERPSCVPRAFQRPAGGGRKCNFNVAQLGHGAVWAFTWAATLRPSGVPASRGWWSHLQLQSGAIWAYTWAATLRPSGVPAPRGWWLHACNYIMVPLWCSLGIQFGPHPASFGRSSAPRVRGTHAITVWCNLGIHLGYHPASLGRSSAPRVVAIHYGAAWAYTWAATLRPSDVPSSRGWGSQAHNYIMEQFGEALMANGRISTWFWRRCNYFP